MRGIKLLVIEDDADQRELIRETLEERFGSGTVVAVADRDQALRQDLPGFDLILSDYNLPDSTGMQLLEDIQARCSTPVILVTGENVGRIAAEAIVRGATDYIVKVGDYLFTIPLVVEKNLVVAKVRRENERLRAELQTALNQLKDKNAQLEVSLRKIEEVAATDPLTGLYNRRHFGRVVEQLFSEAQRYDGEMACVMIDLDGYKLLNDKFGHQIGDQLLMTAGKVIAANMRKMDVAARYGGDEFVVLLPRAGSEEAFGVMQRVREEFRVASARILCRETGVGMSIGISSMRGDAPSCTDQLIAAADTALYRAKAEGRDRTILSAGATSLATSPVAGRPVQA